MKNKKSVKIVSILLAVLLALTLTACGKKDKAEPEVEKPKEKKPVVYMHENGLSGLDTLSEKAVGKRPVAVMVNNVEPALPQYGIEEADLIFEIPVEADLTRLMALYGDYTKVPRICSVRSCRYYYPIFAMGYDAFYVHWGIDETVKSYVYGLGTDQFDGMSFGHGLFGRDQNRINSGYRMEHTGYFDGTAFDEVLEKEGYRLELSGYHKDPAFKFCKPGKTIKPDAEPCTVADIYFGGAGCTLTYDSETKEYRKDINGHPHIDGNTGNQLSFKNAFILETYISIREDGLRKHVDWQGGDDAVAYYLTEGTVQTVHWKKEDGAEDGRLIFFDDQGEEITVNRGKSYIAVTYPGSVVFAAE